MNTQSSSSVLCAQAEPEPRPILQTQKRAREPARAKYLGRRESHFCAQCQHTISEKKSVGFWPLFQKPVESWLLTAADAGDNGTVDDPTQGTQTHLLPQDTQHHDFQPPTEASQPQAPASSRITSCGPASWDSVGSPTCSLKSLIFLFFPLHVTRLQPSDVLGAIELFCSHPGCLPGTPDVCRIPQQLMNFRVLLYVFRVLRQDSDPCLNLSQRFRDVKPVFIYWAAFASYHGPGGLNNRNLFSHDSLAVGRVDFLGGPLCLTCRWPPSLGSSSCSPLLVRTPVIFGFGLPLGLRLTFMTSLRSYLHRQSHSEILGITASTSELARDTIHNLLKEVAGPAWFTCWQVCPPPQLVSVPRSLARVTWQSANITHLLVIEATPRLGGQPFLLLVYIMPPQVLCGIRWSYI